VLPERLSICRDLWMSTVSVARSQPAKGLKPMLVTNTTAQDYYFGPLHLAGGNGSTLTVDDTSATSLYLSDDTVADAINYLYTNGKISVSGQALPFPRPTGKPDLLHGDGSPEGLVYASEGSLYLRRDTASLYQKSSMVHINTGWQAINPDRDQAKRVGLGYKGETFSKDGIASTLAFTSGDFRAAAVGLLAGDVVKNVLVDVTGVVQTITTFKVGVYDTSGNLVAQSANNTTNLATGPNSFAVTAVVGGGTYLVPADGLYYLGVIIVATTMGSLGASSSQVGKGGAIGTGPKAAGKQTGQAGLPATFALTAEDQPVWLGWS
jgi:hypothetical protein